MSKTFTGYTNLQFNSLPGWTRDLILQLESDVARVTGEPKANMLQRHVSFNRVNVETGQVEVMSFDPVHVDGVRNKMNAQLVSSVLHPFDHEYGMDRKIALELINFWNATDPRYKYWLTHAN